MKNFEMLYGFVHYCCAEAITTLLCIFLIIVHIVQKEALKANQFLNL